jgi:hypothetical protein
MVLRDDERRELLALIEAAIREPDPGRARRQLEAQKSLLPERETADALPQSSAAVGMLLPLMAPVAATTHIVELFQRRRLRRRFRRDVEQLRRLGQELASSSGAGGSGSPYRDVGNTTRAGASPAAAQLGDSERVALLRYTRNSLHRFRAKRPLYGLALAARRQDTPWELVGHAYGYDVADPLARLEHTLLTALPALGLESSVEGWIFREGEPGSLVAEHHAQRP